MERLDNPTQEDWFAIWLDELVELGYVKSYLRGTNVPTFTLTEEVRIPYIKQMKTKSKQVDYSLLKGSTYTPDFLVYWSITAMYKFVDRINDPNGHPSYFLCDSEELKSFIDVKSPVPGLNSSDVSFSLNRKIIYKERNIFINKVVLAPSGKKKITKRFLFGVTGAPERFFYTDKTMMKKVSATRFKTIKEKIENDSL